MLKIFLILFFLLIFCSQLIASESKLQKCFTIDRSIAEWRINDSATSVKDFAEIDFVKINVFPNPSLDEINFDIILKRIDEFQVNISDINGNLIWDFKQIFNNMNLILNWDLLNNDKQKISSGIYFLNIITNNNNFSQKFIIEK